MSLLYISRTESSEYEFIFFMHELPYVFYDFSMFRVLQDNP